MEYLLKLRDKLIRHRIGGPRVAFIHVHKAGGTSLTAALTRYFRSRHVCPAISDQGLAALSEVARYRLFAGHFSYSAIAEKAGDARIVTMLRDPADRLLSFFYFMQSHTMAHLEARLPERVAIKTMSLDEYLEAGAPFLWSPIDQIGDGSLSLAVERLEGMPAFGILEEAETSARHILRALSLPYARLPLLNVTGDRAGVHPALEPVPPERVPITADRRARIEAVVAEERQFYAAARDLFLRRTRTDRATADRPRMVEVSSNPGDSMR